jgi:HSP20 family protein
MQTCSGSRCDSGSRSAGSALASLRREFERQFGLESSAELAGMTVTEYPDRWTVAVDVPGVSQGDIEITFEDGSLAIEGERKLPDVEGGRGLFNDRTFGKFRRVLKVREAIDKDAIEAELKDGVLTLVLKRSAEATPRKIAIRTASV